MRRNKRNYVGITVGGLRGKELLAWKRWSGWAVMDVCIIVDVLAWMEFRDFYLVDIREFLYWSSTYSKT